MTSDEDINLDDAVALLTTRASRMNIGLGIGGDSESLPYLINPVLTAAELVLDLARATPVFAGSGGMPLGPLDDLVAELFKGAPPAKDEQDDEEEEEITPEDRKAVKGKSWQSIPILNEGDCKRCGRPAACRSCGAPTDPPDRESED